MLNSFIRAFTILSLSNREGFVFLPDSKEHTVDDFVPNKGLEFVDPDRKDIEGLRFKVELSDGKTVEGTTEKDGIVSIPTDADGDVKVTILLESSDDEKDGDDSDS